MRATIRAAALILLGGCSVPLDGGKCQTDANCPSGQRCGYGRTCSAAAAACAGDICKNGDTACSADGVAVFTCMPDANGICASMPTSGGTACAAAQICSAGACQPMYQVAIVAPAASSYVGTGGVTVTVSVTRLTSQVGVASVSLVPSAGTPVVVPSKSQSGLAAIYEVTYTPGSVSDGPLTLTAVAMPGTADATSSSPIGVIVDETLPAISNVTFSCGTCLRDAILSVTATVSDAHLDTGTGGVVADIDFGAPFSTVTIPLSGTPPSFSGTLDLKNVPFPFLLKDGKATVRARDLAQNTSSLASTPKTVTRLRWSIAAETTSAPALTAPAVEAGNLFLGGSNGKVYKVDPVSGIINRWPVASAGIAAAPSVGATGLWVSGQDSKAYILDKTGGGLLNTPCATVGPTQTTAAVGQKSSDPETGYVGSQGTTYSQLYAVRVSGSCIPTTLYTSQSLQAAPAIDAGGNVYAAVGSSLHSYLLVNTGVWSFAENWTTPPVVGAVSAPLAIDATPLVWTAAMDGSLKKTNASGTAANGGTAGAAPDAPVLDAAGNVIVGDGSGVLHKMSPSGTALWASPPSLGAATASALVLSGGDAAYVVPTAAGTVAAVKADGTILWSGQVTAATGTALREPNILKLAGEAFSTAVFGAADGNVYGVIVDGDLDASSPWPKAHHDTRNTGNASTPLP